MFGYKKLMAKIVNLELQNQRTESVFRETGKQLQDGLLAMALRIQRLEDNMDALVKSLDATLKGYQTELMQQFSLTTYSISKEIDEVRRQIKVLEGSLGQLDNLKYLQNLAQIETMFRSMVNTTDKLGRDYDRLNDTIVEHFEGVGDASKYMK